MWTFSRLSKFFIKVSKPRLLRLQDVGGHFPKELEMDEKVFECWGTGNSPRKQEHRVLKRRLWESLQPSRGKAICTQRLGSSCRPVALSNDPSQLSANWAISSVRVVKFTKDLTLWGLENWCFREITSLIMKLLSYTYFPTFWWVTVTIQETEKVSCINLTEPADRVALKDSHY